jgi:hypothetical protein
VIVALLVSACTINTGGSTATPNRRVASSATGETTTTMRSTKPTLVPGGWGDAKPGQGAIDAMVAWAGDSIDDVNNIFTEGGQAADAINDAIKQKDIGTIKAKCQQITQDLTIRLQAYVPTPDADLTNAFQNLIRTPRTQLVSVQR